MSQAIDWSVPLSGPASPDVMADRMDKSFDELLSSHSGASRPAYAVAGTRWVSTATAGKLKYYEYDGAADRLIKTIDTTTGLVTYADVDGKLVYASKSGNYTALSTDNNAVHRYTAAATVSLTAAATLAANWHYTVTADGGAVTIDPNASETINGLATLIVPDGSSVEIICDGTGFFAVFRPNGWVTIGAPVTLSGQTVVDWTDLGSFRHLRMTLQCTLSAAARILVRVSTNNGSSFLSGASDYARAFLVQDGTTVAGSAAAPDNAAFLTASIADADVGNFTIELANFNKNLRALVRSNGIYYTGSSLRTETDYGYSAAVSGRNALRLFSGAGNFASGQVTLEGIRG